jgi:hypothetical protein
MSLNELHKGDSMKSLVYKSRVKNYSTLYNLNNSKIKRKIIIKDIVKNTINSLENNTKSVFKNLETILSNLNYRIEFVKEFELKIDKISTIVLFELFHYLKKIKSEELFKVISKNKYDTRMKRVENKIIYFDENVLQRLYFLVEVELYIRIASLKVFREKIKKDYENFNYIEKNIIKDNCSSIKGTDIIKFSLVGKNKSDDICCCKNYKISLILYDEDWNYSESYSIEHTNKKCFNNAKNKIYDINIEDDFKNSSKYLVFSVKSLNNENLALNLDFYRDKEHKMINKFKLENKYSIPFIIDLKSNKILELNFDFSKKVELIESIMDFYIVKKIDLHEMFFIHSLLEIDKFL